MSTRYQRRYAQALRDISNPPVSVASREAIRAPIKISKSIKISQPISRVTSVN